MPARRRTPPVPDVGLGRRGSERPIRILEAAEAMFATLPYDDVQTSEIARRADVAAGLPFHYFGSKRGLYLATLRWVAERASPAPPPAHGTPTERIAAYLDGHLGMVVEHREAFIGLMRGGLAGDPEVRAIHEQMRDEGLRRLLDPLGLDGRLSPRLRLVIRGWVGALDEATVHWLELRRPSRKAFAALMADVLIASLAVVEDEHPALPAVLRELNDVGSSRSRR